MKPLLLAAIGLFCCLAVTAQNSKLVNGKFLAQDKLIQDYDLLFSSLTNYHPSPFSFISEKELEQYYLMQRSQFPDSISEREFYIIAKRLIALLKCSHTTGSISENWITSLSGNAVLLPFEVHYENGKCFIKNTVDEAFEFRVGDELLGINGLPIHTILMQVDSIQTRDGIHRSFANPAIALNFRMYYLFLYGYQDSFEIQYRSGKAINKTEVKSIPKRIKESMTPSLPNSLITIDSTRWSIFAIDTLRDLAYLRIESFADRKEYKKYYKRVFQELDKSPDSELIIDLRNNTGGYFGNGNELLRYLSPEKFEFNFERPKKSFEKNEYAKLDGWGKLTKLAFSLKPAKHRSKENRTHTFTYSPQEPRYDGKIHVITNGFTLSQAFFVTTTLDKNGAIFYGTQTGGAYGANNAMLIYEVVLPNSKFKARIPYYKIISNSKKIEHGRGVVPDYEMYQGFNSVTDRILESVVDLVGNQ